MQQQLHGVESARSKVLASADDDLRLSFLQLHDGDTLYIALESDDDGAVTAEMLQLLDDIDNQLR